MNMPHLCLEERNRLLGHLQAGGSPTDLVKLFGISGNAVYKISSKFRETGTLKNRPRSRSGRPRVTDLQTDDQIVATYRATPMKQVTLFSAEIGVSRRTVVRRLNFEGLYSHRPALKPRLSEDQKRKRLQWAKEHERWIRGQWNNVMFSDEATFEVDSADHKTRCFRRKGERFLPQMVLEKTSRG